jgi:putative peptide zinc metalloprotease protein
VASGQGVFHVTRAKDLPGRYFRKGEILGYVTDKPPDLARVVVTQAEVDVVRQATRHVQLRLAQNMPQVFDGRLVREVPAGESRLPSPALSVQGGGQITVDPQDPQGTRTLERLFQFDVQLDQPQRLQLFGQRVHVRFEHPWEPLAAQWFRTIRRVFLSRFHV